jgi:hypothetical protein
MAALAIIVLPVPVGTVTITLSPAKMCEKATSCAAYGSSPCWKKNAS